MSCGNPVKRILLEISKDIQLSEKINEKYLIPDFSIQYIQLRSMSFFKENYQEPSISGVFSLEYNGVTTGDLPVTSLASEIRDALEQLPAVKTVSVSKDFSSYPLVGACVDLEIGSSLVRCSESCVCNFRSNGVQGNDLIKIANEWFRVHSTYDSSEVQFNLSSIENSLVWMQYSGNFLLVWRI